MEVANTLAYYDMATITAVKFFIVQAPGDRIWEQIYPNFYTLFSKCTIQFADIAWNLPKYSINRVNMPSPGPNLSDEIGIGKSLFRSYLD
jgi:hypothetical protein